MSELITGFDVYNLSNTGGVTMTLTGKNADDHHIPVVFVKDEKDIRIKPPQRVQGDNDFDAAPFSRK